MVVVVVLVVEVLVAFAMQMAFSPCVAPLSLGTTGKEEREPTAFLSDGECHSHSDS